MRTTDYMSDRDLQDLRDAGRGHLIDGGRAAALIDKADELRKRAKEEPEHDVANVHDGKGSGQ